MRRNFLIVVLVAIVLVGGALLFEILKDNTSPISNPPLQNTVTSQPSPIVSQEESAQKEIVVDSPQSNQEVESPLTITGKARGPWYFEGSFTAALFDNSGEKLGTAVVTAQGDWMTEDYVSFSSELTFVPASESAGILVLSAANPSGLPENEKSIEIPVRFN